MRFDRGGEFSELEERGFVSKRILFVVAVDAEENNDGKGWVANQKFGCCWFDDNMMKN